MTDKQKLVWFVNCDEATKEKLVELLPQANCVSTDFERIREGDSGNPALIVLDKDYYKAFTLVRKYPKEVKIVLLFKLAPSGEAYSVSIVRRRIFSIKMRHLPQKTAERLKLLLSW